MRTRTKAPSMRRSWMRRVLTGVAALGAVAVPLAVPAANAGPVPQQVSDPPVGIIDHEFDMSYELVPQWEISKQADEQFVLFDPETGGAATDYTVTVAEREPAALYWRISGRLTVVNLHDAPLTYRVGAISGITDQSGRTVSCSAYHDGDLVHIDIEQQLDPLDRTDYTYVCESADLLSFDTSERVLFEVGTDGGYETAVGAYVRPREDWELRGTRESEVTVHDSYDGFSTVHGTPRLTWTAAGTEHVYEYTRSFVGAEVPEEGAECVLVENEAHLREGGPFPSNVAFAVEVVQVCRGVLSLEKTADATVDVKEGETITYTFVATNESESAKLTDVAVRDVAFSGAGALSALQCDKPDPVTLEPGEQLTCTAEYRVERADAEAGKIENVAEATANEAHPATDDETVTTAATPPTTPVTPTEGRPGGLPSTGVDGNAPLLIGIGALVLVAAGGALALVRRRRAGADAEAEVE